MGKTVLVTGAGSGFGALIVRALADAGHTVHAGIRDLAGRNAPAAAALATYASSREVALRAVELDVRSQDSVDNAVASIAEPLDVVVHNAAYLALGPAEAFTPADIADVMDTNVSGPQRVNRAVLPRFRERRHGLVVWIGSSSTKGGTPPYLAPYFAAKAAMDAFAVSYAAELARFDIETTIVVPGVFAQGTSLFANGHAASDTARAAAYDAAYPGLLDHVAARLSDLAPPDIDADAVATAVTDLVALPHGTRPFRVHIDPVDDGSEAVSTVADAARTQFLTRLGLSDLLHPHAW